MPCLLISCVGFLFQLPIIPNKSYAFRTRVTFILFATLDALRQYTCTLFASFESSSTERTIGCQNNAIFYDVTRRPFKKPHQRRARRFVSFHPQRRLYLVATAIRSNDSRFFARCMFEQVPVIVLSSLEITVRLLNVVPVGLLRPDVSVRWFPGGCSGIGTETTRRHG